MERKNDIPAEIRFLVPFADFMENHPVITNIILTLEALAALWAVFTYDFTTNF